MGFRLTDRDRKRLAKAHPHLARVIERAASLSPIRFVVIECARTVEKQREYVAKGVSWTMNSRHIPAENGHSHAVDIAPLDDAGKISWAWPLYHKLAPHVKRAAKDVGVPIEWGGDWRNTKDGPHWQLPWDDYPGGNPATEIAQAPKATDESEAQALVRSRTVKGAGAGAAGGAAAVADGAGKAVDAARSAQDYLTTGEIVQIAIGVLILAGAVYALYARWDDAGRPSIRDMADALARKVA